MRPDYAPYEVNLASALLGSYQRAEAIGHLEHALALDPLLQNAILLLAKADRRQGDEREATEIVTRYQTAMGIKTDNSVSHRGAIH